MLTGALPLSRITLSLKHIAKRPVRYYLSDRASSTLITYGAIKAVVLVGVLLVALIATRYQHPMPVFPDSLTHWDGQWYISIARSNYAENYPDSANFPPLYPVVIKLLSLNQSPAMPWAAVIISNVFSFVALYFLYRLVPLIINERYRLRVCFAFMVFPTLIVSNLVAYSEGLFLALTIGAYFFWKKDKFGLAATLAIGSIFTRQVGLLILVIFGCSTLYGYWHSRDTKCLLRQVEALIATAAGVGALYLFYYVRFGNPFIVAQVEASGFVHNTFSPLNVYANLRLSFSGADPFFPVSVPVIAICTLVLVATVVCLCKRDVALAAYSLVYLLLFLSISNVHYSFIRYVAAAFPVYLFFGLMLSDDWWKNIIVGSIALAIAIQNLYVFLTGAWLY